MFVEVKREESKKRVMLTTTNPNASSTLTTTKMEDYSRDKPWCAHCNKSYHTKETCWKLHGKLTNWKPKNKREKERLAYTTSVPAPLTLEKGMNMCSSYRDY